MAGIDVAARAARDTLAVAVARPAPSAADGLDRAAAAARRDGQQAAATLRLVATTSVPTAGPTGTGAALVPARVEATMAADRALFTVLTAGRQAVTQAANLMASENAQSFLPFTALFGSATPMPALPTTPQTSLRRRAAQAADQARVAAAYADPRATGSPSRPV